MKKGQMARIGIVALSAIPLAGCGTGVNYSTTLPGTATFVQGASSVTTLAASAKKIRPRSGFALTPGDQYLVSPNQAKITFVSIEFDDTSGSTISSSDLTGCVVTYDRGLSSGSSLLDCPFTVPVGQIGQIVVRYSNNVQILVNDTTTGIYSHSGSTTGFNTTAASPDFVNIRVNAGADPDVRISPIIFPTPITVAAGSTPQIFITTDMIHGTELEVASNGTDLAPAGTEDPVALFGYTTKGKSLYFSEDTTIESVKIGKNSVRVFEDAAGNPLFLFGFTCAVGNLPVNAWATPPIGQTIGGWLGKDAAHVISWALPTDTTWGTYSTYFTMAEQTAIGGTTTVNCKATTSPPPPADGQTYASGAPAMSSPTTSTVVTLLGK
jgi:hypothetical protein